MTGVNDISNFAKAVEADRARAVLRHQLGVVFGRRRSVWEKLFSWMVGR